MRINNTEVDLLSNIAKALTEKVAPLELMNAMEKFFNKYGRTNTSFIELKEINIYMYEDSTKTLKDYFRGLMALEETHSESRNDKLYFAIRQFLQNNYSFFLNDKAYKLDDVTNFAAVKCFNGDNDLVFPLKKYDMPFGLLELRFSNNVSPLMNYDFFILMFVICFQISLKIQNLILGEQMRQNNVFHESMKNIAKIIETQYELNYIIPMIGEMIDKFVGEHFVYIFMGNGQDKPYKLVWPATCKDKIVLQNLSKTTPKSRFILSDDEKVVLLPLVNKNKELLGVISTKSSNNSRFSKKEIEYLTQLTMQSSITLQRAQAYQETLTQATKDALTGLNNRRQFEAHLAREFANAKRQNSPLCEIMFDVDFFKKVNDTYGHIAGDCVLRAAGERIRNTVREGDIASRYGGEEFCVILPFTDIGAAYVVAERLRKVMEKTPVEVKNEKGEVEQTIPFTISLGVYQLQPNDTAHDLHEKADKGLYEAKQKGRNRVVLVKN